MSSRGRNVRPRSPSASAVAEERKATRPISSTAVATADAPASAETTVPAAHSDVQQQPAPLPTAPLPPLAGTAPVPLPVLATQPVVTASAAAATAPSVQPAAEVKSANAVGSILDAFRNASPDQIELFRSLFASSMGAQQPVQVQQPTVPQLQVQQLALQPAALVPSGSAGGAAQFYARVLAQGAPAPAASTANINTYVAPQHVHPTVAAAPSTAYIDPMAHISAADIVVGQAAPVLSHHIRTCTPHS
jgi:hypothetical protein